ncbi:MAG: hypothetical protein H7Z15_06305 [Rhizobacter sp.]|nr:hypothetical protein [Rhizobacter sp.]
MRKVVRCLVGTLALVATLAHAGSGEGLKIPLDHPAWEGLKGRLSFGTVAPSQADPSNTNSEPLRIHSLSLMGDYYLSRPWLGSVGGLRATSGLMLGARGSLWSSPASIERRTSLAGGLGDASTDTSTTVPYLGVGYTGLSSKGGWGLSADLGLMALNPRSATKLGNQSLDDTMRDLRFTPLLQLGVSYSF